MEDFSEPRVQLSRKFKDFLAQEFAAPGQPVFSYAQELQKLYEPVDGDGKTYRLKSRRLMVAEYHLRRYDEALLMQLMQKPLESLPAFEDALATFLMESGDMVLQDLLKADGNARLAIGLKGDFGRYEVSPRQLTSAFLNQLVCVFGIVTKASLVRPKLVTSVHYSDATGEYTTNQYRDATSLRGDPTKTAYPQFDTAGNPLTTEYGLCKYTDNQARPAAPGRLPAASCQAMAWAVC
jgi:DNA replication licensing factor MCM3